MDLTHQFGHKIVPVAHLATKWPHLHLLQKPPDDATCTSYKFGHHYRVLIAKMTNSNKDVSVHLDCRLLSTSGLTPLLTSLHFPHFHWCPLANIKHKHKQMYSIGKCHGRSDISRNCFFKKLQRLQFLLDELCYEHLTGDPSVPLKYVVDILNQILHLETVAGSSCTTQSAINYQAAAD